MNLHVHGNIDQSEVVNLPPLSKSQEKAAAKETAGADHATEAVEAVHTVAFMMSDGDNLCWVSGGWATDPKWFGSPDRGKVPLGFTVAPALAALAPTVLAYAHAHATVNDTLVAGPSGIGYSYPDKFRRQAVPAFSDLTASFMKAGGLRLINVIGAGEWVLSAVHDLDPYKY
jgi:hypothetical protein